MLDINVKTIDGQSRSYSVPDNYTVKQFKEKIGNSLNIPVERQRLIFQGRELKDGNQLSDYDVNGKTLHLVQRLPPNQPGQPPMRANNDEQTSPGSNNNNASPHVQQIIQQLIGGLGEYGQNATFNTTNNSDTNGMEVHIDLGNVSQIINENEIRSRIRNIRRFLAMAEARLNRLHEIQSGAPLDDTPNSTIIVGSIHTTTAITDGNNIIGFETNQHNIRNPIDLSYLTGPLGSWRSPSSTAAPSNNDQTTQTTQTSEPSSTAASSSSIPPTDSTSSTTTTTSVTGNTTTTTRTTTSTTSTTTSTSTASGNNVADNTATQPVNNETSQPPPPQLQQQQQSIGVEVLADVIQNVMNAYTRFQPYLQQYHSMLSNDASEPPDSPTRTDSSTSLRNEHSNPNMIVVGSDNRRQRFFNNINDMMHLLGHLFHNISDLHVNIRDRPPRQMHTMSSMSHASSTIIGAVPVEATIQIPISAQLSSRGLNIQPPAPTPPPPATGSSPTTGNNMPPTTGNNMPNIGQATAGRPIFLRSRPRSTQSFSSAMGSSEPAQGGQNQQQQRPGFMSARHIGMSSPQSPGHYSTLNSYDQYLPCNSVHFYNSFNPVNSVAETAASQSQRRRHPAGDQSTTPGQAQATASPPTQQPFNLNQPTSGSNQPNDIGRLLSNILSSTLRNTMSGDANTEPNNTQMRLIGSGLPGGPNISITTITTSSNSGAPSPNSSQPGPQQPTAPQPPNPFLNLLNNPNMMLGSLLRSTLPPVPQQPPPQQQQPLLSILRQAIGLMDSNNQNDARLNQPLRDFMRFLGPLDDADENLTNSRNEASALNVFNVFFSSLSLGDMIDLARGQNSHRVFQRTREPLREYLRSLFGSGSGDEPIDFDLLTDRFYSDVFEDENGMNIDFSRFELVDQRVDLKRSFERLVKSHIRQLLEHTFDRSYDQVTVDDAQPNPTTWSSILFGRAKTALEQLVNLVRACVSNADQRIIEFVAERVRTGLFSGTGGGSLGALYAPFESIVRSHIQSFLASIQTNRSQIEEFITTKPERETDNEDNQSIDSNQFDSVSSTLSGNSMDVEQHFSDARSNLQPEQPVQTKKEQQPQQVQTSSSVLNSQELPNDWLPVIEHDMEKQKSAEPGTGGFSDAYCSGMPAKRRKILSGREDFLTENLFKKVLSRTLKNIQLKANVTEDEIVANSLNQSQLIDSFDDELDTAINERLRNDTNFINIVNNTSSSSTTNPSSKNDDDPNLVYNKDRFSLSRKRFK